MKKMLLASILVLLMASGVFAQVDIDGPSTSGGLSPITGANMQQGQTQTFTPTNISVFAPHLDVDTNIGNGIGNFSPSSSSRSSSTSIAGATAFGYVAPVQQVNIDSPPQALLSPPSQSVPELNFGNGRLDWNFAKVLPKVAIPLYNPNETVVKVLDTTANVKAKNLLPKLLDMIADQQPLSIGDRLIIIKAEAQKSWNTGGNAGGAGSYLPTSGLAGASGAGSIVPSWGGTKADDLYTIIIVRVAL